MRSIPFAPFLVLVALALAAVGCATISAYPSLGTFYVDDERLIVRGLEHGDTVATLGWGDTLEVIDAPIEQRSSDDLFVVRAGDGYGRAERDPLMSDMLFRSKYSHGRPVGTTGDGRHFYRDEFGDTVMIRPRPNVARKQVEETKEDVVVSDKSVKRKKRPSTN
jgi:hypothetical protein